MADPIQGFAELKKNMAKLSMFSKVKGAQALVEELKIELKEANRKVPKLTRNLEKTGQVHPAQIKANSVSSSISYGGPTPAAPEGATYAVYVHEDLEAIHPNGEAKWLESTLQESKPHLPKRVARRLQPELYKL